MFLLIFFFCTVSLFDSCIMLNTVNWGALLWCHQHSVMMSSTFTVMMSSIFTVMMTLTFSVMMSSTFTVMKSSTLKCQRWTEVSRSCTPQELGPSRICLMLVVFPLGHCCYKGLWWTDLISLTLNFYTLCFFSFGPWGLDFWGKRGHNFWQEIFGYCHMVMKYVDLGFV